MHGTEGLQSLFHGGAAIGLAADIGTQEARALAQLGSRLGASLGVDVQQQHSGALRHQLAGAGQAEARAAAGDEEYGVFDTHAQSSNR